MLIVSIFFLGLLTLQIQAKISPLTKVLNDGNIIPIIALGTFGPISEPNLIVDAVVSAIKIGYRHIDTAAYYLNEQYIGQGIANATQMGYVTRDELFITTKLDFRVSTGDGVLASINGSLRRLGLNYVDLYLIHTPLNLQSFSDNDIVNVWKGMEEVQRRGLTRSIGVSNFNSTHINRILTYNNVPPAVNEIEVNPTFASLELVAYCQSVHITVLAYAPFGFLVPRPFRLEIDPRPPPSFNNTLLLKLAKKYHKTTSQVALRYLIERDLVILPKSVTLSHIKLNFDIFNFRLTTHEVYEINNFNRNEKVYVFELDVLDAMSEYCFNVDFETAIAMIK